MAKSVCDFCRLSAIFFANNLCPAMTWKCPPQLAQVDIVSSVMDSGRWLMEKAAQTMDDKKGRQWSTQSDPGQP